MENSVQQKLSTKQQEFKDRALKGENFFLTGKAGTGKSFILKVVMEELKKMKKKVVAVAPTGIAAININGQTIHSLFSINPSGVPTFDTCNFLKSEKKRLLKAVDTIVIDEVSMLRPDLLDAMHWTLLKNGCGGLNTKQIIFVGDMKQLPPVMEPNTRSVLYQTYDGDTFEYAKVYDLIKPNLIELDEVLRQTDEVFISHLNIIREGGKSEYFRQFVATETDGIILAPHATTVNQYNEAGFKNQKGEEFIFNAVVEGNARAEEFNMESEVKVKIGCKIMYLVNNSDGKLVNGTLGIFVSHKDCHYIRVGDVDHVIKPVKLTKKEYRLNETGDALELQEIGSIEQMPIKLAYALTIHKSQGLTFDSVTIDLRRPCFQKGQMYVALSRVRTPNGLRILI